MRAPSKRSLSDAGDHRGDGGLVRARRARPPEARVVVRVVEDVGPPATSGFPGGQVHRGTADAHQRLAGCAGRSCPHHDRRPGGGPVHQTWWTGSSGWTGRTSCSSPTSPTSDGTGVFAYVAFVIDAYAGAIVGWECSTSRPVRGVRDPSRRRATSPARASDRGRHSSFGCPVAVYAVHFGETLSLEGLRPSIGTVGDAYDNALAETTIGLYKNECIRTDSPFRTGPLPGSATSRTPPAPGCIGTTPAGSCTTGQTTTGRARDRLLRSDP